jgi:hypothetical protein
MSKPKPNCFGSFLKGSAVVCLECKVWKECQSETELNLARKVFKHLSEQEFAIQFSNLEEPTEVHLSPQPDVYGHCVKCKRPRSEYDSFLQKDVLNKDLGLCRLCFLEKLKPKIREVFR